MNNYLRIIVAPLIVTFALAPVDCTGPTNGLASSAELSPRQPMAMGQGGSWMQPDAKGKALLYVSLSSGTVDVFDYKYRKQIGMLTGFELPEGQCVNKTGNIWITDFDAKMVVEYAHGGTSPLKTLGTAGNPVGCSVSSGGDVAVANSLGNAGNIEVFSKGSSTGAIFKNHRCDPVWTPGYDLNGNLFFEGKEYSRYSYKINVCELPVGASSIRRVSFNEKISGLGSVMWDGKYLALTNTTNGRRTYVYQAHESQSGNLIAMNTTQLIDRSCSDTEVYQVFIVGTKNTPVGQKQGVAALGGNVLCYNDFDGWSYPKGGKSAWSLSLRFGIGESVSFPDPMN
jgi:hypothetical protein